MISESRAPRDDDRAVAGSDRVEARAGAAVRDDDVGVGELPLDGRAGEHPEVDDAGRRRAGRTRLDAHLRRDAVPDGAATPEESREGVVARPGQRRGRGKAS